MMARTTKKAKAPVKKKSLAPVRKKTTAHHAKKSSGAKPASEKFSFGKLLTAEGWRRLVMKKKHKKK